MDLQNVLERLLESGDLEDVRTNTRAQFGTPSKTYLGASILPERTVPQNQWTEKGIRFRTVIANSGDRYSPAQKKGSGGMFTAMEITLGDADIAREFTGRDYDAMLDLLGSGMSQQAAAAILGWVDVELNLALVELNEVQRWQAIEDAIVWRRGDNSYNEPVYYPNPAGHRVSTLDKWSNPAYDFWPDIYAVPVFLRRKGFRVNRIVTSTLVQQIMLANPKTAQRAGGATTIIAPGGQIQTLSTGIAPTAAQLNSLFAAAGLPAPEIYDEVYFTQVGSARFMSENVMTFFCTTGRDEVIIRQNEQIIVPNTMGFFALGRPVGKPGPGRAFYLESHQDKPPRIEGQAWETGLPVILDPEAMFVINDID